MSKDDKKRIATLWDSKRDDNDQEGQAFYAGGSEQSGQQILGPRDHNNPGPMIENLFTQARQQAVAGTSSGSSSANSGSSALPTLAIRFWRNGFTVGEGDLRQYGTPENVQFLEYLKRGETPPELINIVRNGLVEVKLENHGNDEYKPVKKIKPFSGEGHRLGAPTPDTITNDSSTSQQQQEQLQQQQQPQQQQSQEKKVNEICTNINEPSTNIQVRLTDNSRLVIRVNLTQTISDIVSYVRSARPQYASTNFVLATTYPARELCDLQQTIVDAKLQNAALLQKIK